ncbi:UvrD-helicase domain-containing protein [Kitasatospora purpeofusca]|uniref:UvrD-helicase domain-containing protein n=1 Tax=Kitasatospora purpeofusca TaxID=67352 RepID=UPI00224E5C5C|nr:UvrD-helicase domain-containing protein [Kitasatospora purpeofusca]MCX4756588.1 UvrD-helicase domain-containing protein [Kitasatospora purpeofusca]WSR35615.1 UvrD-helicase domain-containing protein [Kitasatospora purpeofusca]
MTSPILENHVLTAEQQTVVDQPWDARVLVTAGAGAGKTHTLVRRLDALVEREELETSEILVLSFSRAAVRELTERIGRRPSAAQRVRAQTFDAWAAGLLNRAYPETDWSALPFERRIEAATEAIDRGAVEVGEHGVPAHVVVDEVQDLVGARREMVEALLDRFQENCGFTVVGDSAQSVYGFQVSDPDRRAEETDRFRDWLRASFGEDLVELFLGENFRARTEDVRSALRFGPELQRLPRDPGAAAAEAERIHGDLRALLLAAPNFGSLDSEFVRAALHDYPGTTAVLCRDNGQALTVSGLLADAGVPHFVQRSAQERSAPAWIAGLLASTSASTLQQDRFTELLGDLELPPGSSPDTLWRSVRKVARGARGVLDLAALHRALAERRLPDELTAPRPSSLVVSTVHRAKGLEFDRVLVVEPRVLKEPRRVAKKKYDYDPAAEARLLYVAMTRARDDLYVLDAPSTWQVRKDGRLDRWYLGGRSSWARNGIEILGDDVSHELPPGAEELRKDPVGLLEHLRTGVAPGARAELVLLHGIPVAPDQSPPYAVTVDGRHVAVVSQRFRTDLWRMLRRNAHSEVENWPPLITGLRVDCVESVAGDAAAAERAGLDNRGVWLAPRLCGFGRFQWYDGQAPTNADAEEGSA